MTSEQLAQLALLGTSISSIIGGVIAWRKSKQDQQTQATIDAINSWKDLAETYKTHLDEAQVRFEALEKRYDAQAANMYKMRQEMAILELKLIGKYPLDRIERGEEPHEGD